MTHQKIIAALTALGPSRVEEIAAHAQINISTLRKHLRKIAEEGGIHQQAPQRRTGYGKSAIIWAAGPGDEQNCAPPAKRLGSVEIITQRLVEQGQWMQAHFANSDPMLFLTAGRTIQGAHHAA